MGRLHCADNDHCPIVPGADIDDAAPRSAAIVVMHKAIVDTGGDNSSFAECAQLERMIAQLMSAKGP
ncbi:unnamed protein product, partial [Iphiclides podalirius]